MGQITGVRFSASDIFFVTVMYRLTLGFTSGFPMFFSAGVKRSKHEAINYHQFNDEFKVLEALLSLSVRSTWLKHRDSFTFIYLFAQIYLYLQYGI
jgi:hypothetical protein